MAWGPHGKQAMSQYYTVVMKDNHVDNNHHSG